MSPEEDQEKEESNHGKILNTFDYRIGGHTTLLTYDENTICKLAKFKEKDFYENLNSLPNDLIDYIPKYKGEIKVVEITEDNNDKTYYTKCKEYTTNNNNNELLIDKKKNLLTYQNISSKTTRHFTTCPQEESFIKLENLIAKYKYPCVLDIKMGQRQYDDNQTEEIKKLQIENCKKTTSNALGAKIHGMQVYQVNTETFIKYGREHGNTLSTQQFYEEMKKFFYNGETYRIELLDPILERLKNLKEIINKMNKYRFYDSSILITYDGLVNSNKKHNFDNNIEDDIDQCEKSDYYKLVNIHIIDFTHVHHDEKEDDSPDKGYLFGLDNVIEKIKQIKDDIKKEIEFKNQIADIE